MGGVFGQLAAGGNGQYFFLVSQRAAQGEGARSQDGEGNRQDALFSEHEVYAAQSRWEKQTSFRTPGFRPLIDRIIAKFEEFAAMSRCRSVIYHARMEKRNAAQITTLVPRQTIF